MILQDFHTHTTFSDGSNTPEEMIRAAIARGMKRIGFSDHSYTHFDERYCMRRSYVDEEPRAIAALREKYKGQIEVYSGVEQDYWSDAPTDGFDYVIGSVHYVRFGDEYIGMDEGADLFRYAAEKYCGGDAYQLTAAYFRTVADVKRKTGCDIVGHFDVIRKFNRGGVLFDENDPRYLAAAFAAVDALIPTGVLFEINTGAVHGGYRDEPYPAPAIRDYIAAKGGRFILSSDSHATGTLLYGFDRFAPENAVTDGAWIRKNKKDKGADA